MSIRCSRRQGPQGFQDLQDPKSPKITGIVPSEPTLHQEFRKWCEHVRHTKTYEQAAA
jgi:hypothetical protein